MALQTEIPISLFEETIHSENGALHVEIEQVIIGGEEFFRCVVTPIMPINANVNTYGKLDGDTTSTTYMIRQIVDGVWIDIEEKAPTAFSKKISKVIEAKLAKQKRVSSGKDLLDEYNKFIPFEPPYKFNCIVGNKHISAQITGKHNHPIHHIFVIEFNGGIKFKVVSGEGEQGLYLDEEEKDYDAKKKYFYAALQDIKLFFSNGGSTL
jgi:hypothetical protein